MRQLWQFVKVKEKDLQFTLTDLYNKGFEIKSVESVTIHNSYNDYFMYYTIFFVKE